LLLFDDTDDEGTPGVIDGTGLAEALLGLDGFKVLSVTEGEHELVIAVETTTSVTGCFDCGVQAECQDRVRVDIRDLACFGRPARLVWSKRRWRCRDSECPVKTWTEHSAHVPARAVLTCRAGIEACRQVGELARPVSGVADELGVCWWTVMHAVGSLGVDETSFLKANREHPTIYATGLVDLDGRKVIDMVQGNAARDLRRWCAGVDPVWLADIEVVATDLAESYRAGLSPHLDHAVRVAV
jgi:transposase